MKDLLRTSRFLTWFLTQFAHNRLEESSPEMKRLRAEAGYGTEGWKARIASTYVGNQLKMCAFARGSGFKFAGFLQPNLALRQPYTGGENSIAYRDSLKPAIKDTYQRIRNDLFNNRPVFNSQGCFWGDLSNIYSSYQNEVFVDVRHVTNKGNKYTAARLHDFLKENAFAPFGK
jgi:hypothetical protein